MKRLTTDNPKGCFEKLMNFAYTKHNRVNLSYADGKDDIDLCKYVSKLAKAKGFDFSPEFIMEDGLFDNYDDDFAVLYYLAVQAAELRSRLKLYEDKLENGTLIELPCKVGDTVYYIANIGRTSRLLPFINEYSVFEITHSKRQIYFHLCHKNDNGKNEKVYHTISIEKFNKNVFTDKSKAEAKLKELKENENA